MVRFNDKGQITNFNYLVIIICMPIVLMFLTALCHFFFPPLEKVFGYCSFGSFGLILFGFFLSLIFFAKPIKSIRRDELRKHPYRGKNYFFDIIEESKRYGWSCHELDRYQIHVKGHLDSQQFEVLASYKWEGSSSKTRHQNRSENISVVIPIIESPDFYLTQGNLPGLLGEKIIKIPNFELQKVTAIGEKNQHIEFFLQVNKNTIEQLFAGVFWLSDLVFEKNQMEAIIGNDTNEQGETEIYKIVKMLCLLSESFNKK
ncbi:MAG: hypothetical protein HQL26_09295 [Candidatus Omnitrophica bacterium]|nr:hypothetical protein [Candidatus Omnitrophota bacterium]